MLNTEQRQDVDYFVGVEVEHTMMKGHKTLFVVGIKPVDEIKAKAAEAGVKHIYFGTSQSYNPIIGDYDSNKQWENMIVPLLEEKYWVTLDFDVKYAEDLHESSYCDYDTFIPMISVKLPYIKLFNYNATLKIDDRTWGATNPGVWSHRLDELKSIETFTPWHAYEGDTPT
jgi:hypothetical protein